MATALHPKYMNKLINNTLSKLSKWDELTWSSAPRHAPERWLYQHPFLSSEQIYFNHFKARVGDPFQDDFKHTI